VNRRLAPNLFPGIDSRIEPVPFRPEAFFDEDPLVWEIKKEGILVKPASTYGKRKL
jgi:hypothetical protein